MFFQSTIFKKNSTVLVINFTDGAFIASAVRLGRIGTDGVLSAPELLFSVEEPHTFFEKSGALDYKSLVIPLKNALNKIIKRGISRPDKIAVILPSFLYRSEIRQSSFSEQGTFTLTEKKYQQLLEKEHYDMESEKMKRFQEIFGEVVEIERKVVKMALNGYTHIEPIGLRAERFDFTLYLTVAPKALITAITTLCRNFFHHEKLEVNYFSGVLPLFVVSRNILGYENNFVLYRFGRKSSEVIFAEDGALKEQTSFAFGTETFEEELVAITKLPRDIVLSQFMIDHHGSLSTIQSKKIEKSVIATQKKWLDSISVAFQKILTGKVMPRTILFVCPKQYESWLLQHLQNDLLPLFTTTGEKTSLIAINGSFLNTYVHTHHEYSATDSAKVDALFINSVQ